MAVIEGGTSAALQEVDSTFKAGRVTIRPAESLAWHSVGARSGAVTTATATGALFSFRNLSGNPIIVRRIGVGFVCTAGFTAGQELAFGLKVARAFTASDSGGTAIAITGNNTKMRTALALPTSVDCRIATTGALTAGTKTLDTNDLATVGAFAATTTTGTVLAPALNNLLSHDTGDYPLVLAQNEGFNIQNLILMGAGGVGTFYANIEFAEAAAY